MGIRYAVNENFFRIWNQDMAYILGFLFADGSMENASYIRGKYVRVSSTDKDIILKIRDALNSLHSIVTIAPSQSHRKTRYLLRIGNKKLYDSLVTHGLQPRKSLTMDFPSVPERYLPDFIRGYFDGDGCAYIETRKNKFSAPYYMLKVIFTSGSRGFLETLAKILHAHCVKHEMPLYSSLRSFQLRYSLCDSIAIFEYLYCKHKPTMFLERKLKIFLKYFKLQKGKGPVVKQLTRRSAKPLFTGATPVWASRFGRVAER